MVIVNYNTGDLLLRTLAAVRDQVHPPERVMVMDNGSTDGSLAHVAQDFPSVEIHRLNQNLGFARANNIAAQLADDCDWLALLNPDAFPAPEWLASLVRAASAQPDVDVFACCMLSAQQPEIIDGVGDSYCTNGMAWPTAQGRSVADVPPEPIEVFAACAGAAFYRRDAFMGVGGFDENYFCYHEDVDLGFRLRLDGRRCVFLPTAIVYHMGSAVTGKGSNFSVYHAHRNMVWTYVKNMPSPYFWIYLPTHLAVNVIAIALFVAKGQGRTILRAKWHALTQLPLMWQRRRMLQRRRRVRASAVVGRMQPSRLLRSLLCGFHAGR